MELDYSKIGKRIASRRKMLGLSQEQVGEMADISRTYMSSIERAQSIPSTEVIMRLAFALDTTPDTFLVGAARMDNGECRDVAELLRGMNPQQLSLAKSFLTWLLEELK